MDQQQGLAHTRTRPAHWLGTALALGAVVAAAVALAPAGAAAPVADGPHTVPASAAPDPARVAFPLDCAGLPTKVTQRFSADTSGNGSVVTVVAVHCDAQNGTPPDGLYVLRAGPGGKPRIAATLISPGQNLTVRKLGLRADGAIHASVDGYSSADAPRCCPDLHQTYTWTPGPDGYSRTVTVPLSQV
ncbi:hypothetical protein [Streptacidiphilus sp. PAMC 29251]